MAGRCAVRSGIRCHASDGDIAWMEGEHARARSSNNINVAVFDVECIDGGRCVHHSDIDITRDDHVAYARHGHTYGTMQYM